MLHFRTYRQIESSPLLKMMPDYQEVLRSWGFLQTDVDLWQSRRTGEKTCSRKRSRHLRACSVLMVLRENFNAHTIVKGATNQVQTPQPQGQGLPSPHLPSPIHAVRTWNVNKTMYLQFLQNHLHYFRPCGVPLSEMHQPPSSSPSLNLQA